MESDTKAPESVQTSSQGTGVHGHVVRESYDALQDALKNRILLLDGAMGTMIQAHKFEEADFRADSA